MGEFDKYFRSIYLTGNESNFAPKSDLKDKNNYSRNVFIEVDGSVSEIIRLNVLNDRHREEIIGYHFAQHYAKFHYSDQLNQPQFYMVGRDSPWDFDYVMHDGSSFSLEVCRLADRNLLKAIKIENDITSLLLRKELCGFEIQKIEKHFPGTLPRDLVEKVRTKQDRKRVFPLENWEASPKLFVRPPMYPQIDLREELEKALRKKAEKKHSGKDRTIIVLDNITTHSTPEDFFSALEKMNQFIDCLPFNSVWLYTGYYSDDDGHNCEYSMIPIKLSEKELKYLTERGPK